MCVEPPPFAESQPVHPAALIPDAALQATRLRSAHFVKQRRRQRLQQRQKARGGTAGSAHSRGARTRLSAAPVPGLVAPGTKGSAAGEPRQGAAAGAARPGVVVAASQRVMGGAVARSSGNDAGPSLPRLQPKPSASPAAAADKVGVPSTEAGSGSSVLTSNGPAGRQSAAREGGVLIGPMTVAEVGAGAEARAGSCDSTRETVRRGPVVGVKPLPELRWRREQSTQAVVFGRERHGHD